MLGQTRLKLSLEQETLTGMIKCLSHCWACRSRASGHTEISFVGAYCVPLREEASGGGVRSAHTGDGTQIQTPALLPIV